jgi:hypothetical protein
MVGGGGGGHEHETVIDPVESAGVTANTSYPGKTTEVVETLHVAAE